MTTVAQGADRTLAGVLVVGQALLSFVVGGLSLLLVMVTDGCGTSADDPLICSDGGVLLFIVAIGVEWLLLVGGVVFSIVMSVRAGRRGRRAWPWPFAGTAIGALGVLFLFVSTVVMTR